MPVGDELLGRVSTASAARIDGQGPPPTAAARRPIAGRAARSRCSARASRDRVTLGVRALDALVPCGRGQRLGIFAGSGVGKSSLLGHDRPLDDAPT